MICFQNIYKDDFKKLFNYTKNITIIQNEDNSIKIKSDESMIATILFDNESNFKDVKIFDKEKFSILLLKLIFS